MHARLIGVLLVMVAQVATRSDAAQCSPLPLPPAECSDAIDNDGDERIDLEDESCKSASQRRERATACSDGIDNDGDGRIDVIDSDCSGISDDSEHPPPPACGDGIDNDGDGRTDFGCDPGCDSIADGNEMDTGGVGCTGSSCICGQDVNGDGTVFLDTESQSCDVSGNRAVCPMEQVECSMEVRDVWNPRTERMENQPFYTCPVNGSQPCVQGNDGKQYCSTLTCIDQANPTILESNNPEGEFPQDNGARDAAGNCQDKLSVFAGKPSRCRKRGTQTAWQDCCDNELGTLQDTMGAPGEPGQREYRDEATDIEFWNNQCDIEDQRTSLMRDSDYCVEVGTYCKERWALIGCVQRARAFCCFSSKLGAMIQLQGRAQIPSIGGFGSPEEPNCRGFTLEEFQALDFSKIDLSGYYNDLKYNDQATIQQEAQDAATQTLANPH